MHLQYLQYSAYIPLTNRGSSYRPHFSTSIYCPNAKYEGHEFKRKKQGAVTHSTDPKNEVNTMFIISLRNWIKLKSTPQGQVVHTLEYGLPNQPITLHVVPERYNSNIYSFIHSFIRSFIPGQRHRGMGGDTREVNTSRSNLPVFVPDLSVQYLFSSSITSVSCTVMNKCN